MQTSEKDNGRSKLPCPIIGSFFFPCATVYMPQLTIRTTGVGTKPGDQSRASSQKAVSICLLEPEQVQLGNIDLPECKTSQINVVQGNNAGRNKEGINCSHVHTVSYHVYLNTSFVGKCAFDLKGRSYCEVSLPALFSKVSTLSSRSDALGLCLHHEDLVDTVHRIFLQTAWAKCRITASEGFR